MPPQHTRYYLDESRPDTSTTRDRGSTLGGVNLPSKSKRNGSQLLGGNTLKDGGSAAQAVVSSSDAHMGASKVQERQLHPCGSYPEVVIADSRQQMDWPNFDSSVLHAYRYTLHLDTPPAFTHSRNERLLSQPGIGQMSPTMARPQTRRRIGKEELAIKVRKDFNAAIIHEQDIITSMLYAVQNHGELLHSPLVKVYRKLLTSGLDSTPKVELNTPLGRG